jgi:hypothetical protein
MFSARLVSSQRDSPTTNAENGPDPDAPYLLLALSNQEYDIEEAAIGDDVSLVVKERAFEVLYQLIEVLKLVSN